MADYYKYYKKNNSDPKSKDKYREVLLDYLESNRDLVSKKGYNYRIPRRLGNIQLRKFKKEVTIDKDGNVVNKLVINWKKTKALWKENPEAKERKIKIRYTNDHTNGYVFRIVYVKYTANYKNKSVYKMLVNREMRRNTKDPIINKKVDAFLLNSI
jgi:hypothetical protein